MYYNEELQNHLDTSSVLKSSSLVVAEWNMNIADNILQVGNYRYRPSSDSGSVYRSAMGSFDPLDAGKFYTDATYSDVVIDGGMSDDGVTPVAFQTRKQKEQMLFSLEACFGRFRPRSGINKLRYFSGKFTHNVNEYLGQRPRYYMADKDDPFKYWTSYRTEDGVERGIANIVKNGQNFIDDAAPYVVYKSPVPANRIVVKMQTNVGTKDLGYFSNISETFPDPLYGSANKTTPTRWKIQYLNNNNWVDAISFNSSSTRKDGSPVIREDGYVEISYGLMIPSDYQNIFKYISTAPAVDLLPEVGTQQNGNAYLVKASDTDQGTFYIVINGTYQSFSANYGWHLTDEEVTGATSMVSSLVSPDSYVNAVDGSTSYRELTEVSGLRILVDTMNKFDSTFDLIELSPRLVANITDKVVDFSITKNASDLGVSGMPVGQLLASVGSMTIFDYDQSFSETNSSSIISGYTAENIQMKFYETILDVNGSSYTVPIKVLYSEGFPEISSINRMVKIQLRDMFLHFEAITAPQILAQDASLSYAISTLLDYAGFSNYVFKRNPGESEMVIPNFSVAPDRTLAEILSDLAVSSQSAMFFDESNNFVVMSKNYMMPTQDEQDATNRPTASLRGSSDQAKTGVLRNGKTSTKVANIIELASQNNHVYNDGIINYKTSYIQRSYPTVRQASMIDSAKTWVYKPALLWEVSQTDAIRPINDESNSAGYSLSAVPLDKDLSADLPYVSNNTVFNNTISFGEGVYWLGKYNGYFYANGEIIRFDAVQYSIPGLAASSGTDGDNVWISSVQEYQNYFSKVPFNGKIYPTGLVRIFTEPNYEIVEGITRLKSGPVAKHGRGQFGTDIVEHKAGVSSEWTDSSNLRGVNMNHKYLFSSKLDFTLSGAYTEIMDRGPVSIGNMYETEVQVKVGIVSSTDSTALMTSVSHGLIDGQLIYLKTSGQLPGGIFTGTVYEVVYVSNDTFKIKENGGTLPVSISSSIQSGIHKFVPILTSSSGSVVSMTNGTPGVITKALHGLDYGYILYFTTTGNLPDGLLPNTVYTINEIIDENTFSVTSIIDTSVPINLSGTQSGTQTMYQLAYPSIFTVSGGEPHRLLGGDRVYLTGDQAFESIGLSIVDPSGTPLASDIYTVSPTGLGTSTLLLIANGNNLPIHTFGTSGDIVSSSISLPRLLESLPNDAEKTIVLPDVTNMSVGLNVSVYSGTGVIQENSKIVSVDVAHKRIVLDLPVIEPILKNYIDPVTGESIITSVRFIDKLKTVIGAAGKDNVRAATTSRNGIIKNFLSNKYLDEAKLNSMLTTQSGAVQASALVMNGSSINATDQNPSFVSYVYKKLDSGFKHFGARMRVVGKINNNSTTVQTPVGVSTYYTSTTKYTNKTVSIGGSSGGIGILINPETNNGYYLEIVAMTENNVTDYADQNIHNVIFYKLERNANATSDRGDTGNEDDLAVPTKLWGGLANIVVDAGTLVGQYRMSNTTIPTVYDLSAEYEVVGDSLKFYLYLNNSLIATVYDKNPLPIFNNMALFVRGSSRVMFENVFALTNNYSQNTVSKLDTLANGAFGAEEISVTESFQKYAMSGILQSTYLSGISTAEPPKYKLFYDEFGTIMREAAYFDVRYDKAYPALYAKLSPTFNKLKGYTVSGFIAGAYKASFLVFNATDTALALDSTSGNYLRIQGITFTQQSQNELSVDSYFSKTSSLSDPEFSSGELIKSPLKESKDYTDIKLSRLTHGKKQFSINTPYIQSQDEANNIMAWMISKIMKPRKSIGVKVFGMPTIQLGDIVTLDYVSDSISQVSAAGSRFVVYSIDYSRKDTGPEMTVYLSEVI